MKALWRRMFMIISSAIEWGGGRGTIRIQVVVPLNKEFEKGFCLLQVLEKCSFNWKQIVFVKRIKKKTNGMINRHWVWWKS